LQLASEMFENKINSKIFKANSLYKQSSRQAHFPELTEMVLSVWTARMNNGP